MAAATGEKPGKVKEFGAEAGAAVGAMPPDPPEETMLPVDEITVEGACQLELFDFGGKKATNARLALRGTAGIAAGEGFKKGTVIKGTFEAVVDAAALKDKRDRTTRQVTDTSIAFSALLLDMVVEKAVPPA